MLAGSNKLKNHQVFKKLAKLSSYQCKNQHAEDFIISEALMSLLIRFG